MYFICNQREINGVTKYGVMDTKDGVVEYYNIHEIIAFIAQKQILIHGVSYDKVNGWTIEVLEPSVFVPKKEVGKSKKEIGYRTVTNNTIFKTSREALIAMEEIRQFLYKFVAKLSGHNFSGDILQFLDGYDCVGFNRIPIMGTKTYYSIYVNPEIDSNKVVSWSGFGIDISDKKGKVLVKDTGDGKFDFVHFDGSCTEEAYAKAIKWFREWQKLLRDKKE